MKNTIKGYLLNNMEVTMELVNELNGWNACLDFLDVAYMEDFDMYMEGYDPMDIANKIFYGDFNPNDEYFRFNGYANLESLDEWELKEEYKIYINEIIEALFNNIDNIEIYDNELNTMISECLKEVE